MEALRILWHGPPLLATGVFAVILSLLALAVLCCRARQRWVRRLGSPVGIASVGLACVMAMGAAMWIGHHDFVATYFDNVSDAKSWILPRDRSAAPVARAVQSALTLQSAALILALGTAMAALVGAGVRLRRDSSAAHLGGMVATTVLAVPVVVGAIVAASLIGQIAARPATTIWDVWHAAEAGRWAVFGLSVLGLMAATPAVVAAGARGGLVGARAYRGAQVLLGVAVLVWSGAQLLAHDVAQGPLAAWERNASARPVGPRSAGIGDSASGPTFNLQLPALRCMDPGHWSRAAIEIPLFVDRSNRAMDTQGSIIGPRRWAELAELEIQRARAAGQTGPVVVVAHVDRRAQGYRLAPYLQRMREFADTLAIVALAETHRKTLSGGKFLRTRSCVAATLHAELTLHIDTARLRWGALARAVAATNRS